MHPMGATGRGSPFETARYALLGAFAWLLACDIRIETSGGHPAEVRTGDSPAAQCESACLHRLDRDDGPARSHCAKKCQYELSQIARKADESREQERAEAEAGARAAAEHAAFLASCAVDRAARRQRRTQREAAQHTGGGQDFAAIVARRDEERRLYAYQAEHCRRELEQQIQHEPCDDGSGIARMCERVLEEHVVYVCPPSAPEAIRGRHPGETTHVGPSATGRGAAPSQSARLAEEDPARDTADDASAEARDEVCWRADTEAEDSDAGRPQSPTVEDAARSPKPDADSHAQRATPAATSSAADGF
jgi:hypothetical protein